MSKEIDAETAYGNESLSKIKLWIQSKFQLPTYTATNEGSCSENGSQLPKIVISRGSEKSLHKLPTSPLIRRPPSRLTNTWQNYVSDGSIQTLSSSPLTPKLPNRGLWSSFKCMSHKQTTNPKSKSLPTTPFVKTDKRLLKKAQTADGVNALPMFRFSAKQRPLTELENNDQSSITYSNSEPGSHSVCGACGHKTNFGSRELIGFQSDKSPHCPNSILKDSSLDHLDFSRLNLRRAGSCRNPESKQHIHVSNIEKAISNIDIQRKSEKPKLKMISPTGSTDRARSLISLTRSWSLKTDHLKLVRTAALSKEGDYKRKMSLNDNELRHVRERRRSSLLRLCIYSESFDEAGTGEGSYTAKSSLEVGLDISPKVTRSAVFKNLIGSADLVRNFRSTFESENMEIPSVYGQIKIMFQFFSERNELQVTLFKGSNLARACKGTMGVYAKVCLMPGKVQMNICNDKHDTQNPVFYEMFSFKVSLDQLLESQLRIKFYNKPGIFSRSKPIGECQIPMYYYDLTALTVIWQNLKKSKGQKDDLDEFDFSPIERNRTREDGISRLLCGFGRRRNVSHNSCRSLEPDNYS